MSVATSPAPGWEGGGRKPGAVRGHGGVYGGFPAKHPKNRLCRLYEGQRLAGGGGHTGAGAPLLPPLCQGLNAAHGGARAPVGVPHGAPAGVPRSLRPMMGSDHRRWQCRQGATTSKAGGRHGPFLSAPADSFLLPPSASAARPRQPTAVSGGALFPLPSSLAHCPAGGSTHTCVSHCGGCHGDAHFLWPPPYSRYRRVGARVACPAGVGLATAGALTLSAQPRLGTPGLAATNARKGVPDARAGEHRRAPVCVESSSTLPFHPLTQGTARVSTVLLLWLRQTPAEPTTVCLHATRGLPRREDRQRRLPSRNAPS